MADAAAPRPRPWRPGRLASPWTIVLAVPVFVALLDPANLVPVVVFAAQAFVGTLPYIAFAVLLIAWLKAAGAEAAIGRAFTGRETRMIVAAALFGGLAPFCSCEVIPFIAGLLAVGAPLSAIMAFWLSSPLIDPPTLLITAAALGWPFAIGKAVAAVGIGLAGGFAVHALVARGALHAPARARAKAGGCCGAGPATGRPVWRIWREAPRRETFRAATVENALFLAKWLAFAYTLEAILVTYLPADVIARVVGGEGPGPVVVAALVGMPAYLNGYVAPALLSGLIAQGMTAAAAMAFMVAGAISSIPAMAAVWALVRPPVFGLYLGLGLMGAIASGLLFGLVL